jgi:hypothetical protein
MFVAEPTAALVGAMLIVTPARSRRFDVVEIDVYTDLVGPAQTPGVHGSIPTLQMAIDDFEDAVLRKLISIVIGDHQLQADHSAGRGRAAPDDYDVDLFVIGGESGGMSGGQITRLATPVSKFLKPAMHRPIGGRRTPLFS